MTRLNSVETNGFARRVGDEFVRHDGTTIQRAPYPDAWEAFLAAGPLPPGRENTALENEMGALLAAGDYRAAERLWPRFAAEGRPVTADSLIVRIHGSREAMQRNAEARLTPLERQIMRVYGTLDLAQRKVKLDELKRKKAKAKKKPEPEPGAPGYEEHDHAQASGWALVPYEVTRPWWAR